MKARILSFAFALIALFAFNDAFAQNVHFIYARAGVDQGTTLQSCFKIAGLGSNQMVYIDIVSQNAVASVDCVNPGENIAPGQRTTTTVSGSGVFNSGKNGQITDCISTVAPTVPNVPTCPNSKWTAEVTDVSFPGPTTIIVYANAAKTIELARIVI